jgi:hypothetical protein
LNKTKLFSVGLLGVLGGCLTWVQQLCLEPADGCHFGSVGVGARQDMQFSSSTVALMNAMQWWSEMKLAAVVVGLLLVASMSHVHCT